MGKLKPFLIAAAYFVAAFVLASLAGCRVQEAPAIDPVGYHRQECDPRTLHREPYLLLADSIQWEKSGYRATRFARY